jgi:hypothetical protein
MKFQKLSLLLFVILAASAQASIPTHPNSLTPIIISTSVISSTPIISITPTQSQVYRLNPPDDTKKAESAGWNSIEYLLSSILLFLLGLFMLRGGIRIIRNKHFYSTSRIASSPNWQAHLIKGKAAIRDGITFIVVGIIIIIISFYLFDEGIDLLI